MTPLSMLSWTLLAMALALLLGVTIRRVLPSMIAFAATFGGCLVLAQTWLPEFLFRVGDIPVRVNAAPPHRMDRLPAAQPPDLARARPQRPPRRGRRFPGPRFGPVAPPAPSRIKSGWRRRPVTR
jgi:hypothetical protein